MVEKPHGKSRRQVFSLPKWPKALGGRSIRFLLHADPDRNDLLISGSFTAREEDSR
jgi:hypothetical protein